MKCPKCEGTGEMQICEMGFIGKDECDECHGKGYLTNDEWRKTCSAEEFAEFLFIIGEDNWLNDISNRDAIMPHEKDVVEWLKQPHTKEETK